MRSGCMQGRIFTDPSCPELSPAERRRVYQAFPATLAALHSVRPADVGLLQYGRPEGYAKRQVEPFLPL
jgi:aminoglycoside phosphotransferase (APT) family kinase protein